MTDSTQNESLLEQLCLRGTVLRSSFDLVKGEILVDTGDVLHMEGEDVYVRCKKTGTLFQAIDAVLRGEEMRCTSLIVWNGEDSLPP